MLYNWFVANIFGTSAVWINLGKFTIYFYPAAISSFIMLCLFIWASIHLITDLIMAFRAVFGFGYKKRKGGSH